MKNIYYITNMFPGKRDNYGIFCKKIYDFFKESEEFNIVKISAIYGKSHNKYYNICRYAVLLFSILYTFVFQKNKFEIVYIQYVWKHAFFITHFFSKIKGKKLFLNFHGEDLTKYQQLSKKEKEQFQQLCDYSTGIIVPSNYFKRLLLDVISPFNEKKVIVSPSGGVDSTNFYLENLNKKEKSIVYCSRFDKDKGWDDFIEAAKILNDKNKDYSFTMIGYGKETNDVINLINEKSLTEKIKLIINPKQSIIAQNYVKSDLFIFPTRLPESLGLVALEAMSCGLVVISSEVGATDEYVINNKTGYLYEKGNVKELVQKIEYFFSLDNSEIMNMKLFCLQMADEYKDKNVQKKFIKDISILCR